MRPNGRPHAALLVAVGVLVALGLAVVARAANPPDNPSGAFNIVTSPLPISLATKPGTAISTDIRLQNAGTGTEHLKTTILTFGANGEDGTPQLITPTPDDTFIKWATATPGTFTVAPNQWATVHLTINVPKAAAYGYYYAVVFSRANEATPTGQHQANLSGAVATLVLLDAEAPGTKRSIQVAEFSSDHAVYEFLPSNFKIRLHNDGNVHVAPTGNIFITAGTDTNANKLGMLDVNFAKGNILPNTNRLFTAKWDGGYPIFRQKISGNKVVLDANGHPESYLDWSNFDLTKLRFGQYTAHLIMAYDDGTGRDVPIEAVVSFWVIPWRILGVVLLVVLLLGFGLWSIIQNLRRLAKRAPRR